MSAIGQWRADQHHFSAQYVRCAGIYNDFLRRIGIQRMAACMLSAGDEQKVLCIARAHDAGDFSADELGRLNLFASHLVRAAELQDRLQRTESQLAQATQTHQALPHVTLWPTASGYVSCASPSAETLLATGDGLALRHGQLHWTHPRWQPSCARPWPPPPAPQAARGMAAHSPHSQPRALAAVAVIPGDLPEALNHGPTTAPRYSPSCKTAPALLRPSAGNWGRSTD